MRCTSRYWHRSTAAPKLLLGGDIPAGEGAYYPPTVLANVKPGMPAYEEELFGPVASIIAARDEADAIRIANDSVFGLGGAVFTKDARAANASREVSKRARRSSTASSPPIRGCRSAGSKNPVTAASSAHMGSKNSSM